jgi:nucleotide-binding universal stress UspA family protein
MTPKTILVPTDFSQCADRALDYACSLAEKLGATIHLVNALGAALPELSVALTDSMITTLRAGSMSQLEKLAKERASLAKFGKLTVEAGDARDAILKTAEACNADLIVIGSHGRRGVTRFVLGSVAEDVLRRATCPVLVVRMPKVAS